MDKTLKEIIEKVKENGGNMYQVGGSVRDEILGIPNNDEDYCVTGLEENGTVSFHSDDMAVLEQRKSFRPGDVDKFTIVIYLEGDDPDCVDAIIGGEIKMNMEITEEHIENNGK